MASKKARGKEKEKCNNCGDCGKDVAPGSQALNCHICDLWFHIKCQKVSVSEYEFLEKTDESVQWFCKSCKGSSQKIFKMLTLVNIRQDTIEREVKSLSSVVGECSGRIDKLNDKVENVIKELPELVSEKVSDLLMDKQEEENRENNIMFFNIPEGSVEHEEGEDTDCVKELCHNVLGIETRLPISEIYRLGKRAKNAKDLEEKPRPLRVVIKERAVRGDILKNAYKLKDSADFKKVGIGRDLTKRQREANKALRKELQQRKKDQPDRKWAIRRDKIVEVPEKRSADVAFLDAATRSGD